MAEKGEKDAPSRSVMNDPEAVMKWTKEQVLEWLKRLGAQGAVEIFKQHDIKGKDLAALGKDDLRYMHIPVGPALRIMNELRTLKLNKKNADDRKLIEMRSRVLARFEHFYGNCTCRKLCCRTERSYQLTGTSFFVRDTHPPCAGETKNCIDLSSVKDVDSFNKGFNCLECWCGKKGYIQVETEVDGDFTICVKRSEYEEVSKVFRETWELSQLQSVGKR